ncbi:MAG TPA: hypothetical protein VFN71_02025, partial [Methylomirabilota bacterium]|nr:hypothetical protein [Methylomirabilota bacterium]
MSARFTIDLLHPGRVARTWRDWFVGTQGRRRLLLATAACGAIILLIWVFQIPTYLRLSKGQGEIPTLRGDLAKREGDLRILRAALQALSVEAKRQVRWAELLTAFSQQIPPTLKITKVEALRPGAPAARACPPAVSLTRAAHVAATALRSASLADRQR